MNKAMLIDRIAREASITKNAAAIAIESMIDGMVEALKDNERVTLSGFGTWNVSLKKARKGRNPRTGKEIEIAAKRSVRFKLGKQLESSLNNDH